MAPRSIVILQSNYIPWKGYFDLINDSDIFVFYDIVKYTKNDWRNRNVLYTKNGKQWLTIPISASAVNQNINTVSLPNSSWQDQHFKSIYYGYKSAPFFKDLEFFIEENYKAKVWNTLSEINQHLIVEISRRIGIKAEFVRSEDLKINGDRIEKLVNIVKSLCGTTYISGPAAKSYLEGNEGLFSENNIELQYKTYPKYPEYNQLSLPFENSVSILDLIANLGWDNVGNYIYEK